MSRYYEAETKKKKERKKAKPNAEPKPKAGSSPDLAVLLAAARLHAGGAGAGETP